MAIAAVLFKPDIWLWCAPAPSAWSRKVGTGFRKRSCATG